MAAAAAFDLGSALDTALDEVLPNTEETDAPETTGMEAAPEETAAAAVEAAPAAPAGQAAPAAPPEAAPYQTSPDGNSFIIPKADWQGFEGVRSYAKEVQAIFPTAGDERIAVW